MTPNIENAKKLEGATDFTTAIKLSDAKAIKYGKGKYFVRFYFFDTISAQPTQELIAVTIKTDDRKGIARVMRRYHRAEIYLREHPDETDFPKFGYRHIAKNFPTAFIFAERKDAKGALYMRNIAFCYPIKGFVSRRKFFRAKYIYHRKEIMSDEFYKSH